MNIGLIISTVALISMQATAAGFDSGSTGTNGVFAPTTNTVVSLPPNGVLNYTSVTIPAGITVSFQRNAANTPVTLLASGPVKIAGTMDISGKPGADATTPVILGVTNKGGAGGPGGFDGGMGGRNETSRIGGSGSGPGGGGGGVTVYNYGADPCGRGGGFQTGGGGPTNAGSGPGGTYGSNAMFPIIGGSGGGGGVGGGSATDPAGAGGGGGGGALLLVSSVSIDFSGTINAKGGNSGTGGNQGGGGSGGMVRLMAPAYVGAGTVSIQGGTGCGGNTNGGNGRSSIEVLANSGAFNPASLPTLMITAIGGVPVPNNLTGSGDVSVPLSAGNPLLVDIAASGIPTGTVIKLTLNNNNGSVTTVNSSALAGSIQASAASASLTIPSGATSLYALASFTLTLAQGDTLSKYALGERVEGVELASVLGGEMQVRLITVSGKTYDVPAAVLAQVAG